ncbi:MAG: hypothetical protein HZB55_22835 [Deltaproteobacteria bacterium]|nr:hypothetical protein [Deltaproteobacteria bacterium]
MGIVAWFKRWLGITSKGTSKGPIRGGARSARRQGVTAAKVMAQVVDLQKSNAQWPEIWQVVNPDADPEVQNLLGKLRGPHMFVPHAGLNVLAEGCRRAMNQNPRADRLAALQAALRSADPFVR